MRYSFRYLMKTSLTLLIAAALTGAAAADFEKWTNKEGKTIELELQNVTAAGGHFKMRDGRTAILKAADLSEADAKRLAEWKPPTAEAARTPSVFDAALEGHLLVLKGKKLSSLKSFAKPTKYYLFYYTASWCPPCQKFTPLLVDFYNANKPGNDEFDVILVTSDSDEKAMEGYAADKKMPWPQLKLSKVEGFNKTFKHPGTGIPNLVLTDISGKLLKTSYEGETYLGPGVVMAHLGTLLQK